MVDELKGKYTYIHTVFHTVREIYFGYVCKIHYHHYKNISIFPGHIKNMTSIFNLVYIITVSDGCSHLMNVLNKKVLIKA